MPDNPRKGIFDSILATVGNTPIVRLNALAPPGVNVFAKVEAFNPMGSVKDRLALGIIEDAERRGLLKPGQTVIEATSGNTGIGLSMLAPNLLAAAFTAAARLVVSLTLRMP